MEIITNILLQLAEIVTYALEFVGIFIIVHGSVEALYNFAKSRFNFQDRKTIVGLAEALSLSLEFILGAEIIKTMVSTDLEQIISLGGIVIIRVIITLVLHWEIKAANE